MSEDERGCAAAFYIYSFLGGKEEKLELLEGNLEGGKEKVNGWIVRAFAAGEGGGRWYNKGIDRYIFASLLIFLPLSRIQLAPRGGSRHPIREAVSSLAISADLEKTLWGM